MNRLEHDKDMRRAGEIGFEHGRYGQYNTHGLPCRCAKCLKEYDYWNDKGAKEHDALVESGKA